MAYLAEQIREVRQRIADRRLAAEEGLVDICHAALTKGVLANGRRLLEVDLVLVETRAFQVQVHGAAAA